MQPMKVFLVLGLIMGVAFAEFPFRKQKLHGDDLVAAKELLIRNLDKVLHPKYSVVDWFSTESSLVSGSFHKFVVDISDGSKRNECTFTIWQSLPAIENGNEINMLCQGGGQGLHRIW